MGLIHTRFAKEVQEGKVTNAKKNSFQNRNICVTSNYLVQKLENKNSQTEKDT